MSYIKQQSMVYGHTASSNKSKNEPGEKVIVTVFGVAKKYCLWNMGQPSSLKSI